jgi:hypothetical protein
MSEVSERDETRLETRLLESLKLIKEWGTWLVTIQTAAIAAVGALIADPKRSLTSSEILFGCLAVALFTASIVCASFLLVSLPGFYAQNANDTKEFARKEAFSCKLIKWIKLNYLIGAEHSAL